MSDKKKTDLKSLLNRLQDLEATVTRYRLPIFIAFVVLLYGFVAYKINNLSQAEPSPDAVSSQVQSAQIPHIDQAVVKQLQSLQDNSVNVQALFNQARSNPFQ